jgi:hypothetical protein
VGLINPWGYSAQKKQIRAMNPFCAADIFSLCRRCVSVCVCVCVCLCVCARARARRQALFSVFNFSSYISRAPTLGGLRFVLFFFFFIYNHAFLDKVQLTVFSVESILVVEEAYAVLLRKRWCSSPVRPFKRSVTVELCISGATSSSDRGNIQF